MYKIKVKDNFWNFEKGLLVTEVSDDIYTNSRVEAENILEFLKETVFIKNAEIIEEQIITLKQAKESLQKIKDRIEINEISHDMYYSSNKYKEDKEDLLFWENKVKELEEKKL